jgi:hypothetical protein
VTRELTVPFTLAASLADAAAQNFLQRLITISVAPRTPSGIGRRLPQPIILQPGRVTLQTRTPPLAGACRAGAVASGLPRECQTLQPGTARVAAQVCHQPRLIPQPLHACTNRLMHACVNTRPSPACPGLGRCCTEQSRSRHSTSSAWAAEPCRTPLLLEAPQTARQLLPPQLT